MFILALATSLSVAAAVPAAVATSPDAGRSTGAPCLDLLPVAVAFVDVLDERVRDALDASLARGCVAAVEVPAGGPADIGRMLEAAQAAEVPWLVLASAGLVEAMQEDGRHGVLFTIDLVGFDVAAGARRGRALRHTTVLGDAEQALGSREARRVADDAVAVLRRQLTSPPSPVTIGQDRRAEPFRPFRTAAACTETRPLVVLWHKDNDARGKRAVVAALAARCARVEEEIVGMRGQALELASGLGLPLLAVKTTVTRMDGDASHALEVTIDRIDPTSEELKVLAHIEDSLHVRAGDDTEAWVRAAPLVGHALDRALERSLDRLDRP